MFLEKKFSRVIVGVLTAGVATVTLSACTASTVASELERRGFSEVVDINDGSSVDTAYVSAGGCRGIATHNDNEGAPYSGAASDDFTVSFAHPDGTEVVYTNPAHVSVVLEDEAMAFCVNALPASETTSENK